MKLKQVLRGRWMVDHRPVLCAGPVGAWDGGAVYTPQIIRLPDGRYRMYYTGRSDIANWAIGTAVSADLFHWTKHPDPVLLSGEDWDHQIDFPWPIYASGLYHIFFEAKRLISTPYPVDPVYGRWPGMTVYHMYTRSTGVATSADGIHFEKDPNPPIGPGAAGEWDGNGICASRVYPWGDGYGMYYAGSDSKVARTGLAFSKDLRHWTRYEHNPIMDVGGPGAWDSGSTLFGSVVALDDGYVGIYEGEDGQQMQLGLAYSEDRIHWTRFADNPIVRTEHSYQTHSTFVCAPLLVFHEGTLYLLYTHNAPLDGKEARIEIAALAPG